MFYYPLVFLSPFLSLWGCGEKITPVEVGTQRIAKPATLAEVPALTEVGQAKLELELMDGKAAAGVEEEVRLQFAGLLQDLVMKAQPNQNERKTQKTSKKKKKTHTKNEARMKKEHTKTKQG